MKSTLAPIAFFFLLLTSCIVQSPKYTSLEKVMALQIGMTRVEVEERLNLKPYNLKAYTDSSQIMVYIYRVIDRRTLFMNTKPTNGRNTKGKYVQLAVTYSKKDVVTRIESCSLCPDNLVNTTKLDIAKVFLFITVTLPVLLIYFGLKK